MKVNVRLKPFFVLFLFTSNAHLYEYAMNVQKGLTAEVSVLIFKQNMKRCSKQHNV